MEGMSIKDAAKELNVESHVLRYWEEELGIDIKRNSLGHRYYDKKDIRMFKQVQELKEKGFALKDIREGIANYNKVEEKDNKEAEVTEEEEVSIMEAKIERELEGEKKKQEGDLKVIDFKVAQMQNLMNKIVANALRDNKDIITTSIKEEITTDVMRQFDTVMREKEEKEELRFRKLDETLRRLQQVNEEVAATKVKRGFWRRR